MTPEAQQVARELVEQLDVFAREVDQYEFGLPASEPWRTQLIDLVATALESARAAEREAIAKQAGRIAEVADSAIDGCDGDDWTRFNTIVAHFTTFANWIRARGGGA